MEHYAGIDVSLGSSSLCIVDASGTIFREAKVASEPAALISWFLGLGVGLERIGGVMIFDVTAPPTLEFVQYVNNRNFAQPGWVLTQSQRHRGGLR